MNYKIIPDQEYLKKCFVYKSGKIFWRVRPKYHFHSLVEWHKYNSYFPGRQAGYYDCCSGYVFVRLDGNVYRIHRIIWVLKRGNISQNIMIDHINGIRSDNKINNLFSCTNIENAKNQKKHKTNTSGHCGIYFVIKSKKWRSQVWENGKHKHLGLFSEKDAAINAVISFRKENGFSKSHGIRP